MSPVFFLSSTEVITLHIGFSLTAKTDRSVIFANGEKGNIAINIFSKGVKIKSDFYNCTIISTSC